MTDPSSGGSAHMTLRHALLDSLGLIMDDAWGIADAIDALIEEKIKEKLKDISQNRKGSDQ